MKGTMYLLSFLSILGWSFFLSVKFKKYASYFPFFVVTMLILILYLAGLTGTLLIVNRFLFYTGILLPVYTILQFKLTKKNFKELPISLFFLAISGLMWFVFTRHAIIFGWDEFVWGQFTKVIFNTDHIYTVNSAIFESKMNYPPGISLFQYYFLPFKHYSEAAIYFSQGIVVLSAISLIIDFVGRHYIKRMVIFILAIGSALVYFGPGLLSMMNDNILGTIFGIAVLASVFVLRSNKSKLLLTPAIFSLPLIKTTGIVLSLTIVLVVSLDLLISNLILIREKKQNKVSIIIPILIIFVLGFSAITPVKSWGLYLKGQDVEPDPVPSWFQIENSFSDKATEREKTTINNFNKAIFQLPLNQQEGEFKSDYSIHKFYLKIIKKINFPAFTMYEWLLIFAVPLGFITYFQKRKGKVLNFGLYLSLLVGFFIYLLLHLLAYMYYFSEYEGKNLASMDRYISSYFLGLAIITIGSIAVFMRDSSNHKATIIGLASGTIFSILLLFNTPPLIKLIIPPGLMARSTNVVREQTKPFSNYINAKTETESKVWVIYQNSNGWECIMIRYDIVPRRMNGGSGNWSLGKKYGSHDIWTHDISKEDWSSQLITEKYDYVFLARADDNFWTYYGGLFKDPVEAKSKQLFRVEIKNNQALLVTK